MHITELKRGDIIFVRMGQFDFVHCGICIEAGGTFETTKMAHTLGRAEPYAFVVTHLAPKEVLEAKGISYQIVRPTNGKLIDVSLDILSTWLEHLVPYDQNKYKALVETALDVNVIGTEGSIKAYTASERNSCISSERAIQRELYERNKYGLITLAATRFIGPTEPVPLIKGHTVEGMTCTSPIILSLQIAAIAHQISTVNDFWVSDRGVALEELEELLDDANAISEQYKAYIARIKKIENDGLGPTYHSALRLLQVPLEELDFDNIPIGVRVDPYLCPVTVLYDSLIQDATNFSDLGNLDVPEYPENERLRTIFSNSIDEMVERANSVRSASYCTLNISTGYRPQDRLTSVNDRCERPAKPTF